MQLHACVLLLIITTDKTLALSDHPCGGNISLDQAPTGNITLALRDGSGLNHTSNQSDKNLSLCTWLVDIPEGRTVVVQLVQVEGGSSISVRCAGAGEDHGRVLEGEKALLSGCDGNKAALTWTGAGHSSLQLAYYVQEDERNSSGGRTAHRPDQDLVSWPQTGTSFTRTAPVSREVVRREEEGRGRLDEGSEWSRGPRPVSGPSSEDQEPPPPTTPMQGPAARAGRADRETLPLPEEGPNNGAETSGSVHLTDRPISASAGAFPYFHTRHSLSTGTSNTSGMETNSSSQLAATQMALTDAAASNPNTDVYKHAATPAHPTVSGFSVPPVGSNLPELLAREPWGSGTLLVTNGGAVSEGTQPHSRTSANALSSEPTADPAKSHTKPPRGDSSGARAETEAGTPTSPSRVPGGARSSAAHVTAPHVAVGASSFHPGTSRADSSESAAPGGVSQTAALESSDKFDSTTELRTPTSSSQSRADDVQSTTGRTRSPNASTLLTATGGQTQTATQSPQRGFINAYELTSVVSSSSSSDATTADDATSSVTSLLTSGDTSADTTTAAGSHRPRSAPTPARENPSADSRSPLPPFPSSTSMHSSTPPPTVRTHTVFSDISLATRTPRPFASSAAVSAARPRRIDRETTPVPFETSTSSHPPGTQSRLPLPPSATQKRPLSSVAATHTPLLSLTTATSDPEENGETEVEKGESWPLVTTSTTTHTPTAGPPPPPIGPPPPLPWSTPHPRLLTFTSSDLTSAPSWSAATSQPPKYYIVPDQPAAIKVETIELLLQIILEDSGSAYAADLEEDMAAWVGPYLQKAPGFRRLLGVWSSGHAVQNLVEFQTSGALQWLGMTGATSLLERAGLAQAVHEARSFRSSKITNITLGGQQGDVCDWLLQCPSGYECVSRLGTANYTCSSLCHFDYCHHHGICTHHPGQRPVCRCLVGDDFWYMGQRCDARMTRARLVGACLAILLIIVSVICVLALVAVRRYRAILIQAKVDQTRSSYRRFNHFDELSGRFWLRSWAGSVDSLDNPAFTRSDELLHLRALDRPCCYHDDTLSLASTCPSHGMRINTIYPHSSQYAWRGSEGSVGDGVLDSGKASDLSVCSWPVEPIQWTPFPLLQQLASHRTPTVRASRPRSYCEGMELVDLERSWTA